jgi:hypothetical protein
MKLLVIADDDGVRQDLGRDRADVLISCGDVANQVILQTAEKREGGTLLTIFTNIFAASLNHDIRVSARQS